MIPPMIVIGSAEGPPLLAWTGKISVVLTPSMATTLTGTMSICAPITHTAALDVSDRGVVLGGEGQAQLSVGLPADRDIQHYCRAILGPGRHPAPYHVMDNVAEGKGCDGPGVEVGQLLLHVDQLGYSGWFEIDLVLEHALFWGNIRGAGSWESLGLQG